MGLKDLQDLRIRASAKLVRVNHQGSNVEFTVVQKPNQGTIPKTGCYRFRGSFFGYFFGEAKK
jgi:hypothetical protein